MSFTQRLWRYIIGVFLGTLLAFFFFGTRSCTNWLPNKQVRQFLGEPGLMGDERTRCWMRCGEIDMAALRTVLEEGDIEYGDSDVRNEEGTGKFYRIAGESVSAEFVVTDSTTLGRALQWDASPADCDCD